MPYEVSQLLLLTTELTAPEQLLNYLSHADGSVADIVTAAVERQEMMAEQQRYQVVLLDELSAWELGEDPLEFSLALMRDFKAQFP